MSTRMSNHARPLGISLLSSLLLWSATTSAAKFSEHASAPKAVSPAELKSRAHDYFSIYERKRATEPGGLIRDPDAYQKWFDLHWRLTRALDERKAIGDLKEYGLKSNEDGSYTVKVKDFPQWVPLDSLLIVLRDPQVFDAYAPELKRRGFRDQDLETLENYVTHNNPQHAAFAENKSLIESFAAKVQARDRAKLPVEREQVISFVYQRTRNFNEGRRQWAVGLLDSLDRQRQRILVSYFEELDISHLFAVGPSMDELVKGTVEPLISGQYVQAMKEKEKEIQQ